MGLIISYREESTSKKDRALFCLEKMGIIVFLVNKEVRKQNVVCPNHEGHEDKQAEIRKPK
jgi:hypothetical protein